MIIQKSIPDKFRQVSAVSAVLVIETINISTKSITEIKSISTQTIKVAISLSKSMLHFRVI